MQPRLGDAPLQLATVQKPPTQLDPLGHMRPQAPQLATSELVSVQPAVQHAPPWPPASEQPAPTGQRLPLLLPPPDVEWVPPSGLEEPGQAAIRISEATASEAIFMASSCPRNPLRSERAVPVKLVDRGGPGR